MLFRLVLLGILWGSSVVLAQNPAGFVSEQIELKGLTLPCAACSVVSEGTCEITEQGSPLIIPFDEAIRRLIARVASSSYNAKRPSPREIRAFLLTQETDSETAFLLFELLTRTETGQKALTREMPRFLKLYTPVLRRLIAEQKGTPSMWMSIWRLPQTDGIPLDAGLLLTIAARHPQLGLKQVFAELSVSDFQRDLNDLQVFEKAAEDLGSDWAEPLRQAREFLETCIPMVSQEGQPPSCAKSEIDKLSGIAATYLQRVLLQIVLSKIREQHLEPLRVLEQLRLADYLQFRTPETHEVLLQAIDRMCVSESAETRAHFLTEENLKMMRIFAEKDSDIAYRLAVLLNTVALDQWKAGQSAESLDNLRESFLVYPHAIPRRDDFVGDVREQLKSDKDSQLRRRFEEAAGSRTHRRIEEPSNTGLLLLLLGFFIVLAGVLVIRRILLADQFARRRVKGSTLFDSLTASEREELKGLLRFFELPYDTSLDQLTRAFRDRAKETHPDTGQGDPIEFAVLTSKYNRSRELLTRR